MSQSDRRSTLILGVDDDRVNVRLLRAVLDSAGYSFISADSGFACLDLLWRVQPKLILLDLQMPEMDGFETCRRIRGQFPELTAPILFLTASNAADDVEGALAAGGDDFILKPFAPQKLLDRIEVWSHKARSATARSVPARV